MINMKGKQNFAIVNVNNNTMPIINEDSKTRYAWIPFGVYGHDDFFAAVTTAYNVSTTNAACVEGLADLIYGKGLYSKDQTKNTILQKLIPQEETKRVAFDLKLYGNGAYTVYWNDEHTKIVRMYHVPVQTLRAEKLGKSPKIRWKYFISNIIVQVYTIIHYLIGYLHYNLVCQKAKYQTYTIIILQMVSYLL